MWTIVYAGCLKTCGTAGQTELINEICSSNFICNFGTEASRTRDQLRQDIAQWLEAFPDIQHEIVDTVVQNDKTTVRWQGHGTHRAAFMGIPATGNAFEYSGITIFRTIRRADFRGLGVCGRGPTDKRSESST